MQKYRCDRMYLARLVGDCFPPMENHRDVYLAAEVDAVLKRQAAAALSGMDAAKAISYHDLQQAHRLRAESSPEALESERAMNASLTEENEKLRQGLRNCLLLAMKRMAASQEKVHWESIIRLCSDAGETPSPLRS
jgi:hypothetical protein